MHVAFEPLAPNPDPKAVSCNVQLCSLSPLPAPPRPRPPHRERAYMGDIPCNVCNAPPLRERVHTDWVTSLAISRGGGWLASGGHDRKVTIWKVADIQASVSMWRTGLKKLT